MLVLHRQSLFSLLHPYGADRGVHTLLQELSTIQISKPSRTILKLTKYVNFLHTLHSQIFQEILLACTASVQLFSAVRAAIYSNRCCTWPRCTSCSGQLQAYVLGLRLAALTQHGLQNVQDPKQAMSLGG